MSKTNILPRVQKRLLGELKKVGSWEKLAARYSDESLNVNRGTLWTLAKQGVVPTNQELRYRLGLESRPKPKIMCVPSLHKQAVFLMAEETRLRVLKGWRS